MKDSMLKKIIAENALLRAEIAECRAALLATKETPSVEAKPAKKKGKK